MKAEKGAQILVKKPVSALLKLNLIQIYLQK